MGWQTIVALCVMIPVLFLPIIFTLFIKTDGFFMPFLRKLARWLSGDEPLRIGKKASK
jgi:hypothetical protein